MNVKIKAFGKLEEIVETDSLTCGDSSRVRDIRVELNRMYPTLFEYKIIVAVNNKISDDDQKVKAGDEIILMPPFSGG